MRGGKEIRVKRRMMQRKSDIRRRRARQWHDQHRLSKNRSDPDPADPSDRKVLAATVAVGHLFTVNDSSIGVVVKRYFSQLFGTFLLRIGTSTEGLSAQQAAATFMNFLHASSNDSMAMALEGNRLAKVTKEFYDEVVCELASLYCRHQPRRRETLLQFMQPFQASKKVGHRVVATTTMSQLMLSSLDVAMSMEATHTILGGIMEAIADVDAVVRKQAVRGLGNVASLWHHSSQESAHLADDEAIEQVLTSMCGLLSDEASAVRREAVVAIQRACQVALPTQWRREILRCSSHHLTGLLDAEDTLLRGASLDLLGRLCELANAVAYESKAEGEDYSLQGLMDEDAANKTPHDVDAAFFESLQMMVLQCTIRLEDSHSAVSAAASRCLRHITGTNVLGGVGMPLSSRSSLAEQAWELLQRREQAQMDFEQFIFPFAALIHVPEQTELLVKRLQLCRRYLALSPQGFAAPGAPPRTAAGFTAAALLRRLPRESSRPSHLVADLCSDLLERLLAVCRGGRGALEHGGRRCQNASGSNLWPLGLLVDSWPRRDFRHRISLLKRGATRSTSGVQVAMAAGPFHLDGEIPA
eukprot:s888_g9.t1